ncbi:related to BNA4-kynurenine 3-mono oxygenase [Sporisorium reilianum SRZ2]|uniref:Kynurenine 3-monooxygenase n=1 Tax=Sporisorium reilianum (strain SRZ2) TaxID=999809 RepID=E6ZZ64_SPORE|nr:related to BNA4-kynurenine 3-mono oxygenase [Sporisorium reilianum SRZ2]
MSTTPSPPSESSKAQAASPSMTTSNSLLDLLAGAPGRVTSPPSSSAATANPLASSLSKDSVSPASPLSAPGKDTQHTQAISATMSSPPQQQQQQQQPAQDVSALMQQFMAPSSSLVTLSSDVQSTNNKISDEQRQTRPALLNKALQLPPSPPSSVSSLTGSKQRQSSSGSRSPVIHTPASFDGDFSKSHAALNASSQASAPAAPSPSIKTPFDFVSPFDMLSNRDDEPTPQPAPAHAQPAPSDSTNQQPIEPTNGYEAANAGIASLLQKLSASAAANKSSQKSNASAKAASPSANAAPSAPAEKGQNDAQPSEEPSTTSTRPAPTRQSSREPASLPASLGSPDKQHHASRHAAVLSQTDAFDDPKSSGLSVLSPSRSSSAPSIATLDLSAKQPGGLSSLRNTKAESSGVALIPSPFHFPCSVSAAGLLPASRIANLGHNVACYAMSKGKVRLIHVGTGARLLVQAPGKGAIRSIAAFQSPQNDNLFLLAALVEPSKDGSDECVVLWMVPSSFVLEGKESSDATLIRRIAADPSKSSFAHRFTAIVWHPTQPKLAISTSDSHIMIVDVAQQLASSKEAQLLTEAEVDTQSKNVPPSESLAAFAFSPDGSLLATVSAPLECDMSWTLTFKSLGGTGDKLTFPLESPLQESMTVSHLSFITGASKSGTSKADAEVIRGVLIGFKCNTILGLYDLASRSFKHVWKFEVPSHASAGGQQHFNLVQQDSSSSTLLVCNSFRSSIFAVPLEFQPLPQADVDSLSARLQKGLLPWGVQLSYPIHEYALQDPCTSLTISTSAEEADEPSKLFVAFPEGVSVVQLHRTEPPAEEAERGTAAEVAGKAPKPVQDQTRGVAVSAPEPTPEQPSAADSQSTPSKSSKKKNKKKASPARAQAEEAAPSKADESEAPLQSTESAAETNAAPEVQRNQPEASTPAPELTSSAATLSKAPTAQLTSAAPSLSVPAESAHSADAFNAALSEIVTSAVHDAVSANIALGFRQSIENSLPQQVERLVTSTELKAELTRNIAQTILPAVQRTAMEVVSRVLAPHFEDVMMNVSDRVERAIVSEITNVRKTLIAEQTDSFNETEKVVKAIQSQVSDVLKQVQNLNTRSADKIVELRSEDASRVAIRSNGAPRLASADELSEVESTRAIKARHQAEASGKVGSETRKDAALAPAQLPTKCRLPERVAVIGAGPVGCLAALAFAQRGCKVDVFESRPDPRTHEAVARASQRSINLALSTRGITGLRSVSLVGLGKYAHTGKDLADLVLQDAVPMRARMIHVVTKRATGDKQAEVKELSQLYSTTGESINSVDRGRLNNILLDRALMHPNVDVHFEHKLQSVDFDHNTRKAAKRAALPAANGKKSGGESSADELTRRSGKNKRNGVQQSSTSSAAIDRVRLDFNVHSTNQRIPKTSNTHFASFVVGCDGAHSSIRSAMGSLIRMHYTHNYIDTGYVELSIPPRTSLSSGSRIRGAGGVDGKPSGHDAFHLDPNHLHIWPRHSFMLIALPNLDGSFTCTLFAPFKMFASELSTREGILALFQEHFPDALPLIGEDKLVECLTTRRASALGSVQCDPYHYKDRAVLIGDAAHAMLPFYGQGLNCGFEDVRVMFDIIDGNETLEEALETYTKQRHPDLVAILQLAEQNYREMAHSVVSWPYLLRKKLDGLLMSVLPSSMWSSLYAMTTFSNLPYSTVIKTEKRQQNIIGHALLTTVVGIMTGAAVGVYRTRGVWQPVTQRWIEAVQRKA